MIFLIAAQPPPSTQDFSDIEQALVGGGGEEDVHAKSESIKAALQWVRRFVIQFNLHPSRCLSFFKILFFCERCCLRALCNACPASSLRRDSKTPAAPSSSLAKAGSMLTKAVGSFVGGSSGSAITQVRRLPAIAVLFNSPLSLA